MFCTNCGNSHQANDAFCSSCGNQLSPTKTSCASRHKLTIFRESQTFLLSPPINILINDDVRGSISNGEVLTFELDSGHNKIVFSISGRKKSVDFDLIKDTEFVVRFNRITGGIIANIKD